MKVVAIIQARMGSTRLPGKVLAPLCGRPMLWHIVERVKRAKCLDDVFVAVSVGDKRDHLKEWDSVKLNEPRICVIDVPENDLIGRYFEIAGVFVADIIVRICADNPFVDPAEIDRAVEYWMDHPTMFVSNMHQHSLDFMQYNNLNGYPDGIGCEVFAFNTLQWMYENVKSPYNREHPHMIFHNMGQITSPKCPAEISRPDLRLDVNTKADLDYVRSIYEIVYPKNPQFTTKEVIEAIDVHHLERRIVPA